jgi:hypothetical protein
MGDRPRPVDVSPYDQIPPTWVSTSDDPGMDIPTYAWTAGRQRADRALNSRDGDPVVTIRCGVLSGGRQCRRVLGGIWATSHGVVLIVNAHSDDGSFARAYKENLRPGPEPDHLPDSMFTEEEPILLADVRVATAWCRSHGSWDMNLAELRGSFRRREPSFATSPA